ncbi:MAG: hypothetical protein PHC69_09370 [Ruminiclostridium sp.]|nr:hypothetical protein [Ruminiclostridium sp.]
MCKRKVLSICVAIFTVLSLLLAIPLTASAVNQEIKKVEKQAKEIEIDIAGLSLEEAKEKVNLATKYLDLSYNSEVNHEQESDAILKAVTALKTNNEKNFKKAVESLNKCLPSICELPFEEAKEMMAEALKFHLNVDINELSLGNAKTKIKEGLLLDKQSEAEYYGVDITGLSFKEAFDKVEKAKRKMLIREFEHLYSIAKSNNIDLSNLSKDEAWQKVKQVELQKYAQINGVDISGLSDEEAWAKIEENEWRTLEQIAHELGVNIAGLSKEEAWQKVKRAEIMEYAQRYGVNVADLSDEEAWQLIKKAEMTIHAAKYRFDTTGLSYDEILAKVQAIEREDLERFAKEQGIDVSGLSWEEARERIISEREKFDERKLKELAQKHGINLDGLSKGEAWTQVKQAELIETAKKHGVDITGLSSDEAWQKIKSLEQEKERQYLENLYAEAAKRNLDVTGMAPEQILEMLENVPESYRYRLSLEEQARMFNFDPTGLTDEEIEIKLEEAMKQSCIEDARKVQYQEMLDEAARYGIDTTGLKAEEINEKICEKIRYNMFRESLQSQADKLGISINGLTNDEAQAYILKVDQEIRDRADAERNAREDAARETEKGKD